MLSAYGYVQVYYCSLIIRMLTFNHYNNMYILYYPNVVRKFTCSLFPVRMPEDVIKTIQNETEKEKRVIFLPRSKK